MLATRNHLFSRSWWKRPSDLANLLEKRKPLSFMFANGLIHCNLQLNQSSPRSAEIFQPIRSRSVALELIVVTCIGIWSRLHSQDHCQTTKRGESPFRSRGKKHGGRKKSQQRGKKVRFTLPYWLFLCLPVSTFNSLVKKPSKRSPLSEGKYGAKSGCVQSCKKCPLESWLIHN